MGALGALGAFDDMKRAFRKLAGQHASSSDEAEPLLKPCIKKRPHDSLDDGKKAKKKKKKKKVRFDGTADSAWKVAN